MSKCVIAFYPNVITKIPNNPYIMARDPRFTRISCFFHPAGYHTGFFELSNAFHAIVTLRGYTIITPKEQNRC